jgi:hypothetical protein
MKKILILIIALFTSNQFASPFKVEAGVDERVELVSMVFRLAGSAEYNTNFLPVYIGSADTYFAPFKDHEVVSFAVNLINSIGVGYDAPMTLAINLRIENGSVKLRKDTSHEEIVKRWNDEYKRFIILLDDFYKKSEFSRFYSSSSETYRTAEKNFMPLLEKINYEWFDEFFGEKPAGGIKIVISLLNGGNLYGPRLTYTDGRVEIYSITGTWMAGEHGEPVYRDKNANISLNTVHEFCHSFCNPLIDQIYTEIENQANSLFSHVEEIMTKQAYGEARYMMYETLVRACVLNYIQKRMNLNNDLMQQFVMKEVSSGFIFIGEFFDFLQNYQSQRDKYARLRDYMPEIARIFNSTDIEKKIEEMDRSYPKIVSFNIQNGSENVDPGSKEIIVKFDKPMMTDRFSISHGKLGQASFPEICNERKLKWNENDNTELIIHVNLKPEKEYSMTFMTKNLISQEGYPMKEDYYYSFKTGR